MRLNSNSSTSKIEKNKEVIVIYLASGENPFGKNSPSGRENKFVTKLRAELIKKGTKYEFYCINSQNPILYFKDEGRYIEYSRDGYMSAEEVAFLMEKLTIVDNSFYKFVEREGDCFYNGSDFEYDPNKIEELNSPNPKYNYNSLNPKSMEFYSKWIDNIIEKNPDSKILVIDGIGADGKCATNLVIKKAKELEGNKNVCFVASCSCCCTGIIGKDFLSQFRDIENLPLDDYSESEYSRLEQCSLKSYQIANFSDMIIKDVLQINKQNVDVGSLSNATNDAESRFNLPSFNKEKLANVETLPKLAEKGLKRFS
jgi:hypothetical protein